ncbi:MAG: DUF1189 family protein [Alphaproteobacteria bacterium]|nr:DUF1189 family protein [Alphaproteobacteria bacterium]
MKKFTNWLKQGKSRGILITLLISVLLSVFIAYRTYLGVNQELRLLTASPEAQAFLQEFPKLTIKNGQIQDDVVWSRAFPGLNIPVIVDTSSTEVPVNSHPGIYVTRTNVVVQGQGALQKIYSIPNYDEAVLFSLPDMLSFMSSYIIPAFAAISMFLSCWVLFLFTVLLSLIIAAIARVPYKEGKLWRTSLVSSLGLLVVNMLTITILTTTLSFLASLCLSTIASVLLLYWLNTKNQEI